MAARLDKFDLGRRITLWSVAASALLAAGNISVGLLAGSTSVTATGLEFAGDVLASLFVLAGMTLAARPSDENHPYGHGRYETLAGLVVGLILTAGGVGICWRALQRVGGAHEAPASYAMWPLLAAMVLRSVMFTLKFRVGRKIHSASLIADAWNDAVDVLSAIAALVALALTLYDPARFLAADHYGGFVVGVVVVFTGLRIMRDTSLDLTDAAPDEESLKEIRRVALSVPGVTGVDKCLARRSGLQYHVDLHLEVDPDLRVRDAHEIAGMTRTRLRRELEWIADVLIHIEPTPEAGDNEPAEEAGDRAEG